MQFIQGLFVFFIKDENNLSLIIIYYDYKYIFILF